MLSIRGSSSERPYCHRGAPRSRPPRPLATGPQVDPEPRLEAFERV